MDFLIRFPFFWTVVGVVVGTLFSWVINRKVLTLQATAAEHLAKTLDRQIHALEDERNDYRDRLNVERVAHQNAALVIKELESRPDLSSIATLLTDLKDWMKIVSLALEKLPDEFQKMSDAFDERQAAVLKQIRNGDGQQG